MEKMLMNRLFTLLAVWAWLCAGHAAGFRFDCSHLSGLMGLSSDSVYSLVQDPEGYIWVATAKGLNRYDGYRVHTLARLTGKDDSQSGGKIVRLTANPANHLLWFLTDDHRTGCIDLASYTMADHTEKAASPISYEYRHQGRLYLWQYGPTAGCRRIRFLHGDVVSESYDHRVRQIEADEQGNDWILTDRGLYLNGFDRKLPVSEGVVRICLYRNLCLALGSEGVVVYNSARRIVRQTPCPASLPSMELCTGMSLWGESLLLFTPSGTHTYDIIDGNFGRPQEGQLKRGTLLAAHEGTVSAHDGRGTLVRYGRDGKVSRLQVMPEEMARQTQKRPVSICFLTPTTEAIATYGNGLFIYDVPSGKLTHLLRGDERGLIRTNRLTALVADRSGTLWVIGEGSGVSALSITRTDGGHLPERTDSMALPTVITSLTIDGEERLPMRDAGADTLAYTENNVDFHYSNFHYAHFGAVSYQHRLEGVDTVWSAPSAEATARYRRLAPGNYTFRVRSRCADWPWGAEATYAIVIGRPWWAEWPAYAVGALLILLVALVGYFGFRPFHRSVPEVLSPSSPSAGELPGEKPLSPRDRRFLDRLEEVMAQHVEDPDFNVETFGEAMQLGRTQFYTKVKRVAGVSPVGFIRRVRLDHAASLLRDTDLTVDEVRQRCCFTNSTAFYSYFKKQFGQTPFQFRKELFKG